MDSVSLYPHPYTNLTTNGHEEIDDAVSDEHAHQIGDLPLVQHPSHVQGVLEETSRGEQEKERVDDDGEDVPCKRKRAACVDVRAADIHSRKDPFGSFWVRFDVSVPARDK